MGGPPSNAWSRSIQENCDFYASTTTEVPVTTETPDQEVNTISAEEIQRLHEEILKLHNQIRILFDLEIIK